MNTSHLNVGLDAWIIRDGNYENFAVGDEAVFAMEFCPDDAGLSVVPSGPARLEHRGAGHYFVRGRVAFARPEVLVVDFGVLAYCTQISPSTLEVGDWVVGAVYLGVDPFEYREGLRRLPAMPELRYRFRVAGIQLNTTPWIEVQPRVFDRDNERESWATIDRTDARSDDDGRGSYVLEVALAGLIGANPAPVALRLSGSARDTANPARRQVSLYVPEPQRAAIDAVRRTYDPKQHALIPAHVTLCREDDVTDWTRLAQRLSSLPPITLRLDFGPPVRGEDMGILLPATGSRAAYDELRRTLLGDGAVAVRAMDPHITLLHPRNSEGSEGVYEQVRRLPFPSAITFDEIAIIEQVDDGPWRRIQAFPA